MGEGSLRYVTLTWSYPDEFKVKPFTGEYTIVWCKKGDDGGCKVKMCAKAQLAIDILNFITMLYT
jgi:hypothetical protein